MNGAARIMAHMVAFYPDRRASLAVARGLAEGGCSYLEVQFPFSDPTADGPDIQRACGAALAAGFTIDEGFRLLAEIRASVPVPIFLMSYANLLFTRGVGRFLAECAENGVRGVIVPDLPPDCDEGLFALAAGLGLAAAPVVSPSMKEKRLAQVASVGAEYVYATLRSGITGSFTSVDPAVLAFLSRLGSVSARAKVLAGFGISTREQIDAIAPHVHSVVVGSAFVREIAKGGDPYPAVAAKMRALAGDLQGG
jgi:tryptophan synthase alpha chain